jgi:hypothetical protein
LYKLCKESVEDVTVRWREEPRGREINGIGLWGWVGLGSIGERGCLDKMGVGERWKDGELEECMQIEIWGLGP